MRLERKGVEFHENGGKERGSWRSIATCSRDQSKPLQKGQFGSTEHKC